MSLGPIFRRELLTSSRRKMTYWNRLAGALTVLMVIAAYAAICDYIGRDRTSREGGKSFALVSFGLIVTLQVLGTMGVVTSEVAPMIAKERDKKSLDALLATRLSGPEIVLGAMAAGLLRHAAGLAMVFPVLALLVPCWGIDPRLLPLAYGGLASLTFALAAVAVLVSVHARTARRAASGSVFVMMCWMWLPFVLVFILPRVWPRVGSWVAPVALVAYDSSPVALLLNALGPVVRGSFFFVFWKMIALQTAVGAALTLWAALRVHAASRAVYDVEGRSVRRRAARLAWRRPRPPCGDDPVLWNEMYARPVVSKLEAALGSSIVWCLIAVYVLGLYWFATPALFELASDGYGPMGGPTSLEFHPLVRVLIEGPSSLPPPGQARLELNAVARQLTSCLHALCVVMLVGAASESLSGEKERDTWLGLIATPLTGREILRAKMLGAVWKMRGFLAAILLFWLVALAAGAIHPLGCLAALANLAASCWLLAALGIRVTLWTSDRKEALNRVIIPALLLSMSGLIIVFLPFTVVRLWMGGGCPPFLTWLSLVTYDEARAMANAGTYPALSLLQLDSPPAAMTAACTVAAGIAAQAVGAIILTRSSFRVFDAAAGRPVRAAAPEPAPEPCPRAVTASA